jgi:chromosome segregation ATPase
MHARLALIGLLHTETARAQLRIRTIDAKEQIADDLRAKVAEIDINFVRTRQIDYFDTYEKLNRKYKIEKSSQYPILDRLQELNKILSKQEQKKIDYEYKYELLENRLEKINNEIDSINYENELIFNENNVLRNRIANIKKVPTITNYAHIIEQTKKLQHEIDIWTRRVHCAEVSLHIFNKVYSGESFGQSDNLTSLYYWV